MAEAGPKHSKLGFTNGGSSDSVLGYVNGDSNHVVRQLRMCIIGEKLRNDKVLIDSLKILNIPFEFSNSVCELQIEEDVDDYEIAYVVENFDDYEFNLLNTNKKRIYGPTVIKQCAANDKLLPYKYRPLYCAAMENIIVCFTGFIHKEEMQEMVKLVHNMGGSIRKDFKTNVTHLVANCSSREKYKYAVTLGTSIMSRDWIFKTWERKSDINCSANDSDLIQLYKQKPFFSCRIAFLGFKEEDQKDMEKLTEEHGGSVTTCDSDLATHIIIDEQSEIDFSREINSWAFVVRADWFWASIQMDASPDEEFYLYKPLITSPPARNTPSTQTPSAKQRKRKRIRDTIDQLAQVPEACQRKSIDALGKSLNGSFLDATLSPDKDSPNKSSEQLDAIRVTPPQIDLKSLSGRQQVFLELLQTENNYIGILKTILMTFKEPLEVQDPRKESLLRPTELKIIFGNLPPIYEVHVKLRDDLTKLMSNWKEDCSLGTVILNHASDILKAYTSFVNFFEETKEMLLMCDKTKPRFHAFLKICENKPECGRQSLSELLIRPIQRLPSVILLLNDILKHTSKSNSDYPQLEEAIATLKKVLTNINENKRKTEEQVEMFTTISHIDNCPPNLLSSHRSFICKIDVFELGNTFSAKGDTLTMFLFTDMLEICKKRTKSLAVIKSPSTASLLGNRNHNKLYKHLELLPLAHIRRIVNVAETEECQNVFSVLCRFGYEFKDKLVSFTLANPDGQKLEFLKALTRQVANIACRNDMENFVATVEPHELDIGTSEVNTSSLSKAMSRLAHRTSRKVGRAFSFNRTPKTLKRAVSTILSPFQSPKQINDCHLAQSSIDLQEMDIPSCSRSAKVSKKVKASSLGANSSKLM